MDELYDYGGMAPLYQLIGVEAQRDRLAAENATLAADRDSETRWACQYKAKRDAANATLDRLRKVVNQNEWDRAQKGDVLSQFRAILEPEEKP